MSMVENLPNAKGSTKKLPCSNVKLLALGICVFAFETGTASCAPVDLPTLLSSWFSPAPRNASLKTGNSPANVVYKNETRNEDGQKILRSCLKEKSTLTTEERVRKQRKLTLGIERMQAQVRKVQPELFMQDFLGKDYKEISKGPLRISYIKGKAKKQKKKEFFQKKFCPHFTDRKTVEAQHGKERTETWVNDSLIPWQFTFLRDPKNTEHFQPEPKSVIENPKYVKSRWIDKQFDEAPEILAEVAEPLTVEEETELEAYTKVESQRWARAAYKLWIEYREWYLDSEEDLDLALAKASGDGELMREFLSAIYKPDFYRRLKEVENLERDKKVEKFEELYAWGIEKALNERLKNNQNKEPGHEDDDVSTAVGENNDLVEIASAASREDDHDTREEKEEITTGDDNYTAHVESHLCRLKGDPRKEQYHEDDDVSTAVGENDDIVEIASVASREDDVGSVCAVLEEGKEEVTIGDDNFDVESQLRMLTGDPRKEHYHEHDDASTAVGEDDDVIEIASAVSGGDDDGDASISGHTDNLQNHLCMLKKDHRHEFDDASTTVGEDDDNASTISGETEADEEYEEK